MGKYCYPREFTSVLRQLHDGMQTQVLDNGKLSQPFPVSFGVKQAYQLALTLLSLMLSAVLTDNIRERLVGINIRYQLDGFRRLPDSSKHQGQISLYTSSKISHFLTSALLTPPQRPICKTV